MARISRRCPTLADLLKDGTLLATAISEEGDDFLHVQSMVARLGGNLDRIRELSSAKLVAFLHASVRHRYGRRSEQLLRFGLQPFRGLKRSRKKPEAPSAPPEVSQTSQD